MGDAALPWLPKGRESAGFICRAPGCQRWEGMMVMLMMDEGAKPLFSVLCTTRLVHKMLIKCRNEAHSGSCLSRVSVCQRKLYPSWPLPSSSVFWEGLQALFPLGHQFSPACLEPAIPDRQTAVLCFPHSGQVLLLPPQTLQGDTKPAFVSVKMC